MSLPLDVSGLIILHRHIVPPPSNNAFREWRENQHLSIQTFSQTQHAIPHWKKAKSQSFILTAQAWVRMSQWQSFKWKPHQSRMGGKNRAADIYWDAWNKLNPIYFFPTTTEQAKTKDYKQVNENPYSTSVQKIILFWSGTSHMMLMVTSLWNHHMSYPRGLVTK